MFHNIHFISGLPRSGSTLLSAMLKQNPRFHAAVTSPLPMLCGALQERMGSNTEFSVFFDDERRRRLLRGLFHSYYANVPEGAVVFDTNRAWTGRLPLLGQLFPQSRVICCVRNIGWIIDSLERLHNENPTQISRLFQTKHAASVYTRAEGLMSHKDGLVGQAWSMLREAWFGARAKRLILIQYDTLAREPARVLSRIYAELQEPAFSHNFDEVVYDEPEYDRQLGLPGLHTVRPKVEFHKRDYSIPPDLFNKYADAAFWAKPELNRRQVTIL
jgi:sulfotransferase